MHGDERIAHFKRVVGEMQVCYDAATRALEAANGKRIQETLPSFRLDLAHAALEAGQVDAGKKHAAETLRQHSSPNHWNYGNNIHIANQILGRCALREGKLGDAKSYLLKAGATPGSPQLNSFGPQMPLARELLEHGEKETVLDYLDLIAKFWAPDEDPTELDRQHAAQIADWKREIADGKIPNDPQWR